MNDGNFVTKWDYTNDGGTFYAFVVVPGDYGDVEVEANRYYSEVFAPDPRVYFDGEPDFKEVLLPSSKQLTIRGITRSLYDWAHSKDHPDYSETSPWLLWDSECPNLFGAEHRFLSGEEPSGYGSEDAEEALKPLLANIESLLRSAGLKVGKVNIELVKGESNE